MIRHLVYSSVHPITASHIDHMFKPSNHICHYIFLSNHIHFLTCESFIHNSNGFFFNITEPFDVTITVHITNIIPCMYVYVVIDLLCVGDLHFIIILYACELFLFGIAIHCLFMYLLIKCIFDEHLTNSLHVGCLQCCVVSHVGKMCHWIK